MKDGSLNGKAPNSSTQAPKKFQTNLELPNPEAVLETSPVLFD
jgi:hypothetical protein